MSNNLSLISKNTMSNLYVEDNSVYEDVLPKTSLVEISQLNLPSQIAYFSGLSYDLVVTFLHNETSFDLPYESLSLDYSKFNLVKQALTTDLVKKHFSFFKEWYVQVFGTSSSLVEKSSLVQFLMKGKLTVSDYFRNTQLKFL